MFWMWASFCWLGRAPTEPFNEMTVLLYVPDGCSQVLGQNVCERVCVGCVPVCATVLVSVSVPMCLNVKSIYFSVYSLQVCLSPAREQAPAPTDTCNSRREHCGKKRIMYRTLCFTVTNHSDDSHR